MGFRLYDPEIGRFLAIDPLLDIQPSQTPYHYCFNNPTSFTDPTGLYPEKQKGDKVQSNQSMYFYDEMRALLNEFGWKMVFNFIDQWNTFAMVHNINEFNRLLGNNEGSGGYGSGGGGGGREGTQESGNGLDNLNLSYKNTDDKNLKDNVSKCLKVIKLLAKVLSNVDQIVNNLDNTDINIYFLSNNPDNNKEHYISEFGNADLTNDWNKDLPAANIRSWDKDKVDLCLQIETFSAYCENYTPFILLDELMHHAYSNLGIKYNNIIKGINAGEIQHILFYNDMYKELNFDKPGMMIINKDINFHFRRHIEELYIRHCLKYKLK